MDTLNKMTDTLTCFWPATEKIVDEKHQQKLYESCLPAFTNILKQEHLDKELLSQLSELYLPLTAWLANKHKNKPIIIGINGAQGSGKSTLSKILKSLLSCAFNKSVVHLSIDDLYFSREKRKHLAKEIHPLLSVRGVPGTHDIELGKKLLSRLIDFVDGSTVHIPVFNKAEDDLYPESAWIPVTQPVDIILFEGWCVGACAQHESELVDEVNELEKNEDPDGVWRNYVNSQLAGPYQSLFNYIDYLVMLKVPDMASVFEWRKLQEEKLAVKLQQTNQPVTHLMTTSEISRFIMHYERLTRSTLNEMPDRTDILLELNKEHKIFNVEVKKRP